MSSRARLSKFSSAPRQRGVVMVMVVIALLALLAVTGLALDGSYQMLNKTRLQTVVDAAALSAAKTLNEPDGTVALATAEATATFNDNAVEPGNVEISDAIADGELNIAIEFSNTLLPFNTASVNPPAAPALYVRVTATNMLLDTWLTPVVGQNQSRVEASAVAGPSVSLGPTICDIVPMMVCDGTDDPSSNPAHADTYGYDPNKVVVLKAGSPNQAMEKGNFQLIRLDGGSGGNDVRHALAGRDESCINTDVGIETEPGNTVGPVAQGLNTRLGIYMGSLGGYEATYPPDTNTDVQGGLGGVPPSGPGRLSYLNLGDNQNPDWTVHYDDGATVTPDPNVSQLPYTYETNYKTDLSLEHIAGQTGRRVLAMPVGDCGSEGGQSTLPYEGLLCFFLLQDVDQGPDPDVFGQVAFRCDAGGKPGPVPRNGPDFQIVLYKDEVRTES